VGMGQAGIGTVTRDIRITETPTFNEDNWPFWNLRESEERELGRPHWLSIETECELHEKDKMIRRMEGMLRTAMLGFQLWVPKGWDGRVRRVHAHPECVYPGSIPGFYVGPHDGCRQA